MLNSIIGFSLRFKAIVIIAVLGIIVGGIASYLKLPIEAFPDVLNQSVQVITQVPGQAAQDVERMVTTPLENEFAGIPKVIQSRSVTEFGLSVINLTFDDDVDGYWARTQTNEKIATADIPQGITPNLAPMSSVTGEILRYEISSPNKTLTELRTLEDWTLEKQIRQVPGIADVSGYGGLVKTIEVAADPLRLNTYGLSIRNFADTLTNAGTNAGGNMINWPNQSFVVRSDGEVKSLDDLRNIGLTQRGSTSIKLKDIASVFESHAPIRGVVGRDEKDQIVQGIALLRKGDNPVTTGQLLNEKLKDINSSNLLPEGVKVKKYYDRTDLVNRTLKTVAHNLLEGIILVVVILFLFLQDWAATLIITFVVPLSLFFAFIMMKLTKTPANLISLGALDFGIIIDGALIIVEFVLLQSAIHNDITPKFIQKSVTQIIRSVFFSMCMIITAYLPIFTLERVEGKMFGPLAWTICFALLGALLASLTFIPALLPTILEISHKKNGHTRSGHNEDAHEPKWFLKIKTKYEHFLKNVIFRNSKKVYLSFAGLGIVGLIIFILSGTEFIPELDEGALWIRATYPHSTSLEEGVKLSRKIRLLLRSNPEIKTAVSQLGGPEDGTDPNLFDNCEFFVDLKPKEEWTRFGHEKEKLIEHIRSQLDTLPGIDFNISQPIADNVEEAISGAKGKNVVKIYGKDIKVLSEISNQIQTTLHKVPGIVDLGEVSSMPMVPQLTIRLDRSRVAQSGVLLQDINDLIEIAVGGKKTAVIYDGETKINVVVRAAEHYRSTIEQIKKLPVPLPNNKSTELQNLADIKFQPGPLVINHEEGYRRLGVKFNVQDRDLGSVVKDVQSELKKLKLPTGYFLKIGGEFENQTRAMQRLIVVVPATAVLIGLLLFMLFSRIDWVLKILFSLLLSTTGSIILLFIRGISFSVPAAVGILVLFGVISLGCVTLTSLFAGFLNEGDSLQVAIEKATSSRLRAILMLGILAAIGLFPAALSHGMGAETQRPLATAVIGGIFTGIPVVLFLLPLLLKEGKRKEVHEV